MNKPTNTTMNELTKANSPRLAQEKTYPWKTNNIHTEKTSGKIRKNTRELKEA